MSKVTADDQFLFLIACIRHANNGKINFEKVAEECDAVSKGAAAKRYERMMKAHGIHQSQGPTGRDTNVQPLKTKAPKRTANDQQPPAKKRKRAPSKALPSPAASDDRFDDDDFVDLKRDGDEEPLIKEEPRLKDEGSQKLEKSAL